MNNVVFTWQSLSAFSLFWLSLTIIFAATSTQVAPPVMFGVNTFFCLLATLCVVYRRHRGGKFSTVENFTCNEERLDLECSESLKETGKETLPRFDSAQLLLLAACILYYCLFAIRLLCVDHFDGRIADFNFGLKPLKPGATERKVNLAFGFEKSGEDMGHFAQGILSVFIFPTFEMLAVRICSGRRPQLIATSVLYLLPVPVIGYPIYNLIKRIVKSRDKFAISSFWNNGTEWACGAMIGICVGLFVTTLAALVGAPNETNEKPSEARVRFVLHKILFIAAVVLHMTLISAIVLLGMTWNVLA